MSLRILGPIALALCLIIVPASGAATPTPDAAQRADTAAALFSAAAVKYPKTKRRLPASIARAFKKAGPRIKAFSAKVEATPFKPDRRKKKKKKKAKASAAGPTMTVSGGSFTTGGVKVEMGAEVRETPSGNREGDLVISFTKGVDRVETRTENSPH